MAAYTDLSCMPILNFLSEEIQSLHKAKRILHAAFPHIIMLQMSSIHKQPRLYIVLL